eukprot:8378508-Pyramimonas_sp.AAC.1
MPRRTPSSNRGLCSTADAPCCEQTAALLLLGNVRKRGGNYVYIMTVLYEAYLLDANEGRVARRHGLCST